jgi:hypothetical protein
MGSTAFTDEAVDDIGRVLRRTLWYDVRNRADDAVVMNEIVQKSPQLIANHRKNEGL